MESASKKSAAGDVLKVVIVGAGKRMGTFTDYALERPELLFETGGSILGPRLFVDLDGFLENAHDQRIQTCFVVLGPTR